MGSHDNSIAITVFLITIVAAFAFSVLGRQRDRGRTSVIAAQGMNRWLVGLSAGATANSGFVVAGAVGLGYSFGLHWVMLPLAWFLGDLAFWTWFPHRINAAGRTTGASTVADLITTGLGNRQARLIRSVIALVVLACLGGYTAAQWLAGEKFVTGAFGLDPNLALFGFAAVIVAYTSIGGFRGSMYTDSYQAVLRLIATTVAIGALAFVALADPGAVWNELSNAEPDFLALFPAATFVSTFAFVLGYAAAALGFGLGQPQVLTRYMSASSPEEAQAAKWIYLFFVQYTWVAMTLFGVLLRGVMPGLKDGETGLAVFFSNFMPPLLTGIIIADIFATIAATANSLIVAMAQTIRYDLLGLKDSKAGGRDLLLPSFLVGAATMALSLILEGNVVTLALSSVAIMGAGLAPSVLIRILGWRCTASSLFAAITAGTFTAIAWKLVGFDATLNEALPGMTAGITVNWLTAWLLSRASARQSNPAPSTLN